MPSCLPPVASMCVCCFRKRVPREMRRAVGTWECIAQEGIGIRLSVFKNGWIEMCEFNHQSRRIIKGQAVRWEMKGRTTAQVTCMRYCWIFFLNLQVSGVAADDGDREQLLSGHTAHASHPTLKVNGDTYVGLPTAGVMGQPTHFSLKTSGKLP